MRRAASTKLRKTLATNIRAYRDKHGLSQEGLAEQCDLHRTYVSQVERSQRNVTLSTLEALAKALGVSVIELLSEKKVAQR